MFYDGTTEFTNEKIDAKYPIRLSQDLYLTADRSEIAIVNNFIEGTEDYELCDPKVELLPDVVTTFFHRFTENASLIKDEVLSSIKNRSDKEKPYITLYRSDNGKLFSYAFGHICDDKVEDQESLNAKYTKKVGNEDCFILPLQVYLFACPVCKNHTLTERGMFEICVECGWEDEGLEDNERDIDFESIGANGDFSIRKYRERYLKIKEKNPNYKWDTDCDTYYDD